MFLQVWKNESDEYLNNSFCTKYVFNNLVITCEDEMVHAPINTRFTKKKMIYSLFCCYCQLFPVLYIDLYSHRTDVFEVIDSNVTNGSV